MTKWQRPLMSRPRNKTGSPVSHGLARALATPLLAGALLLGGWQAVQGTAAIAAPGTSCGADACVDVDAETLEVSLGTATFGPYAPHCVAAEPGAVLPGALRPEETLNLPVTVRNTGASPADIRIYMEWANERAVGQEITDPYLLGAGIPLDPSGKYTSPGMAAFLLTGTPEALRASASEADILLRADSLRGKGMRADNTSPQVTLAVGETKTFTFALAFPCEVNMNDTQREKVEVTLGVMAAGDASGDDSGSTPAPTPTPTPTAPAPSASASPQPSATPTAPGAGATPAPGTPAPTQPGTPSQPRPGGMPVTGVNLTAGAIAVGGLVVAGGLVLFLRRRNEG